MQMFAFLDGVSFWWWIAFGVALGALEMATMSFFLIWPALAAVAIGLWLTVAPGLSGEAQVAIFAVLAVVFTFAGRSLMHRFGNGDGTADGLNNRASQMIGRHGKVETFMGPEGSVTIDSIRWQAIWPAGATASPGDTVRIKGNDGMTLLVGP